MAGREGLAYGLPAYATWAIAVLERGGYEAWAVGGWVRDALRAAPSHDVDITTSAPWPETKRLFEAEGIAVHETGVAHGTITAVIEGLPLEVTTFRTESGYADHRHPDTVRFVSDVREDLARRDLTINAMAYHPERGLLDPFGGQADLAAAVIRAVGDARRRFEEDALRVLRAVRFACRLGFTIERETQHALRDAAHYLNLVSAERIGAEMNGIVASGRLGWALRTQSEALCYAIPELAPMQGFDQRTPYHVYDVLEHTAHVATAVEAFTAGCALPRLRWAALLHDVAKPVTFSLDSAGNGHFYGHPEKSARMARAIMRRLALPGSMVREVCALVRYHDYRIRSRKLPARRLLRQLEQACPGQAFSLAFDLLDLMRADAVSKCPEVAAWAIELDQVTLELRREQAAGIPLAVAELAVSGGDIIRELGVAPGPVVGELLERALAAVDAGEVQNQRDALIGWMKRC